MRAARSRQDVTADDVSSAYPSQVYSNTAALTAPAWRQ